MACAYHLDFAIKNCYRAFSSVFLSLCLLCVFSSFLLLPHLISHSQCFSLLSLLTLTSHFHPIFLSPNTSAITVLLHSFYVFLSCGPLYHCFLTLPSFTPLPTQPCFSRLTLRFFLHLWVPSLPSVTAQIFCRYFLHVFILLCFFLSFSRFCFCCLLHPPPSSVLEVAVLFKALG